MKPFVLVAALAALTLGVTVGSAAHKATPADQLKKVKHIVVIYEENHSFDNLYGGWEGVNGLTKADAQHTTQVDQAGNAYTCLKQQDVNLAAIAPTCADSAHNVASAFTNKWYTIDPLIP